MGKPSLEISWIPIKSSNVSLKIQILRLFLASMYYAKKLFLFTKGLESPPLAYPSKTKGNKAWTGGTFDKVTEGVFSIFFNVMTVAQNGMELVTLITFRRSHIILFSEIYAFDSPFSPLLAISHYQKGTRLLEMKWTAIYILSVLFPVVSLLLFMFANWVLANFPSCWRIPLLFPSPRDNRLACLADRGGTELICPL